MKLKSVHTQAHDPIKVRKVLYDMLFTKGGTNLNAMLVYYTEFEMLLKSHILEKIRKPFLEKSL
jgi:hypothetical protein